MAEKPFSEDFFFLCLVHVLSVNEMKKEVFGKSVESSLKLTWESGYEDRGQDCLISCAEGLQGLTTKVQNAL